MVNILGGQHEDLHGAFLHVMARDPGVKVHLYGKQVRPGRKVGHVTAMGPTRRCCWIGPGTRLTSSRGRSMADASAAPLVGIVMGSDSDWPVMAKAAEALAEFEVTFEVGVVSAHRMPQAMIDYGRQAEGRGLRVIIAGAGGAAHLPGMLAAVTVLPVVGCRWRWRVWMGWTRCCRLCRCPLECR